MSKGVPALVLDNKWAKINICPLIICSERRGGDIDTSKKTWKAGSRKPFFDPSMQQKVGIRINVTKSIIPLSYQMGKLHNSTLEIRNNPSSKIHFFYISMVESFFWEKRQFETAFNSILKKVFQLYCKQINQFQSCLTE